MRCEHLKCILLASWLTVRFLWCLFALVFSSSLYFPHSVCLSPPATHFLYFPVCISVFLKPLSCVLFLPNLKPFTCKILGVYRNVSICITLGYESIFRSACCLSFPGVDCIYCISSMYKCLVQS